MLGAGTVINPIIKIVTTVAILAAVYFFIVKPIGDTSKDISDNVNDSISDSFDNATEQADAVQRQIQRQVRQANAGAEIDVPQTSQGSIEEASRLLDCIQDAAGDVTAMQACQQ